MICAKLKLKLKVLSKIKSARRRCPLWKRWFMANQEKQMQQMSEPPAQIISLHWPSIHFQNFGDIGLTYASSSWDNSISVSTVGSPSKSLATHWTAPVGSVGPRFLLDGGWEIPSTQVVYRTAESRETQAAGACCGWRGGERCKLCSGKVHSWWAEKV